MKRIIIITIIILSSILIIYIPKYEELNNLAIIDAIGIEKENDNVKLILREIVPMKDNNGIEYDYTYYKSSASTIEEALNKIQKNTKKKIYLNRCNYLVLDYNYNENIKDILKIDPKTIYHRANNIFLFITKVGKK